MVPNESTDARGAQRICGAAPDIGAYEYITTSCLGPTAIVPADQAACIGSPSVSPSTLRSGFVSVAMPFSSPSSSVTSQLCGNGKLDQGEQCDPSVSSSFFDSVCCSASSCTFILGSCSSETKCHDAGVCQNGMCVKSNRKKECQSTAPSSTKKLRKTVKKEPRSSTISDSRVNCSLLSVVIAVVSMTLIMMS
eukprot:TRINITY_DN4879_c0_g1_i2.p1 TRINITY_DN4879_c0_g1~~TRINITY_DN4879_c0_g1_i2.p1  ORF type:complete len:193 (-),score=27.31 TRINITY_DN4879_c0_g1_i2:75-653(-)